MKKKLKQIAVCLLVMTLLSSGLVGLSGCGGLIPYFFTRVDSQEELGAMFPTQYFFDFNVEYATSFGAMRDRVSRHGCRFIHHDYHGYEIRFEEPYSLTVYSNAREWIMSGHANIHSEIMIDDIHILIYYRTPWDSELLNITVSFTIDNIPYVIIKFGLALREDFEEKLQKFINETLTLAITNRTRGVNL